MPTPQQGKYSAADIAGPSPQQGAYGASDVAGATDAQPAAAELPKGFFSSALQSSGVPALGTALMHPFDTASAIPGALKQGWENEKQAVQQLRSDYGAQGMSTQTRHDIAGVVPVLGNVLKTAQAQHDAGDNAGMAGTLAGFVGGIPAGDAAASVAAKGLSKVAPVLAETALKVRGVDRAYGATPGQAILDHTTGFTPGAVVDSARQALNATHADQAAVLGNASGMVDLTPTRSIGNDFVTRAQEEGHPGTVKDIAKLNDQLAYELDPRGNFVQTAPIPQDVAPRYAAALNRGLSSAKTSWNPATASDTMNAAAGQMHHQLADSIANVVPEIRPLNQRVQSLMPVVQRGTAADLNAGLLQRSVGRWAAPTGGALTGIMGLHYGGIPGAIAGTILPELVSNPTTLMMEARAANAAAKVLPKVGGTVAATGQAASSLPMRNPLFFAPAR